ncbi:SDR family oxidoreductase [Sphingobium sp. 3R8]|uniref:SDR family NAD(P)-dependent oxidoreductase n=1 Tax=Sphingobium sp. 3R8 TaxID=2874921 RepID=UPI001CC8F8FE|nr:SDR family oxidoreductase [Sphingobium sp. 3R8]MBZ9646898.1 SDR family oxidoreductase [Sphingobium sp. 3R8]
MYDANAEATSGILAGKCAIVTGGAGGIGRAYGLRLAQLGANVAIIDVDLHVAARWGEKLSADTIDEELRAYGVSALAIQADLSNRLAATAAIDEIGRTFGRIDILVNNAGGAITPIETSFASQSNDAELASIFGVNFYSMVYCCQAALPILKRQGGAIVNVSTIGVDLAPASGAIAGYAAAKAAVLRYTRHLAVEVGPHAIRVNAIAPGIIETARVMAQSNQRDLGTDKQAQVIPLRRLGTAADCTGTLEYLVTDMSLYVTGECIRVSGGYSLVAAG